MNQSVDNSSGDHDYARLPNDQKLLIDRLCSRFEAALKGGSRPKAEAVLRKLPTNIRPAALGELLPLEADYRRREGRPLTLPELEERFPDVDPAWLANCVRTETSETEFGGSIPAEPEPPLPERLGDYRIVSRLGVGGMGTVYRAVHERMGREVAVKLLRPEIQKNPMLLQRFDREVRAVARLSHPNIVTALDAREHEGLHFLVTELVDGRDLDQTVRINGPLPPLDALECVLQAARGLAYAHSQGVIHRDIKPANLLKSKDGTIKILDMGLARISNADSSTDVNLTGTGVMMGTAAYMPPEQARDTRKADARSDLYSLGCTLFYLLTGRTAFTGTTQMDMILSHVNQPIPSLRQISGQIPVAVDRIFQRLVAKNPDERFQSAEELISALLTAAEECRVPHDHQTLVEKLQSLKSESHNPATAGSKDHSSPPVGPSDFKFDTGVATKRSKTLPQVKSQGGPTGQKHTMLIAGGVTAFVLILTAIFYSAENESGSNDVSVIEKSRSDAGAEGTKESEIASAENNAPSKQPGDIMDRAVLHFNGASSYAVASSLNPTAGASYTIEVRIRPQSIRASNPSNVVSWLGPDWMAIFIGQNGTLGLARRTGNTSSVYSSTHVMQPGQWCHVAASFESDGMRLFVNGRETELSRQPFELPETRGGLFIGGVDQQRLPTDQNDRFFPGLIESVRVTTGSRYTNNFTPSMQLTSDEKTLAVFLLSRSVSDSTTMLTDVSKQHTLQLHDAEWLPLSGL